MVYLDDSFALTKGILSESITIAQKPYESTRRSILTPMFGLKSRLVDGNITICGDSSHGCHLVTDRSVTGILLCTNKIPVKFFVERQNNLKIYSCNSKRVPVFTSIVTIFEHMWGVRKKGFQVSKATTQLVEKILFQRKINQQSTISKKSNSRLYRVFVSNIAITTGDIVGGKRRISMKGLILKFMWMRTSLSTGRTSSSENSSKISRKPK